MIDSRYALIVVVVMTLVTVALRALPFVAARFLRRYPVVDRLGSFLPPAIMTLLLVHTLASSAMDNPQSGPWAELLAAAAVIAIHLWRRQPLLSMLTGTVLYVLLRNPGLWT
jgi:branched-subunit amino acid transport protein AzlD